MENLEIWNKNQDVDIKFTKQVRVTGKPNFTNLDSYKLLEMATEQFGEYGKGFGIKTMAWSEKEVDDTTLLILDAVFFFDGGEFPYRNSLKYIYKTKSGYMKIDEDAPKKLITNTVAKCLSMLGFGASVYLGMFEDDSYINEMINSQAILIQPNDVNKLLKGINYYKVSKEEVLKHFHITHLKDLPQNELNEAEALIKKLGEKDE